MCVRSSTEDCAVRCVTDTLSCFISVHLRPRQTFASGCNARARRASTRLPPHSRCISSASCNIDRGVRCCCHQDQSTRNKAEVGPALRRAPANSPLGRAEPEGGGVLLLTPAVTPAARARTPSEPSAARTRSEPSAARDLRSNPAGQPLKKTPFSFRPRRLPKRSSPPTSRYLCST